MTVNIVRLGNFSLRLSLFFLGKSPGVKNVHKQQLLLYLVIIKQQRLSLAYYQKYKKIITKIKKIKNKYGPRDCR